MKNQKCSSNTRLQEVIYSPCATESGQCKQELVVEDVDKKDTFFLYFVVLTGTMCIIVGAGSFVWTSPVIPKLKLNDTTENPIGRPATTTEISLIAGLPPLSMILGSLLLGKISELIGRKHCLQVIGLTIFSSGIAIAFSSNVFCIILFRCLLYMFYNGYLTVFSIYLTEICEDHNRAKYGCLMGVFLPFGNLYSYILGSFFSVKYYSLLLTAPLILFLIFFCLAPESPVYSLKKERRKKCIRALKKLRNYAHDNDIKRDIEKIEVTFKGEANARDSSIFQLFTDKELRYALLLATGPVLVQNLSGVTIIMAFMAPLFNDAGFSGNYMSIVVGAVKVTTITLTSFIVERTGRRPLLLISALGTGVPLFILGFFFYLKSTNSFLIPYLQWIPLICIISNVVMYSLGLGSIPMAIMGELFTPDTRATAVSFVTMVMGFCIFATTTSYPFMAELLGTHWCVWIYSCICFLGAVFIFTMIPETKGKSILELQEYLRNKN